MILQVAKDGHLYILDAANLRRFGGAPRSTTCSPASGMSIHGTPAAYKTAMGQYFVINTTSGATMCPGGVSGRALVALKISRGEPAGGDGRLVLGDLRHRVDGADRDDDRRHRQRHRLVHQQRQHRSRRLDGDTGAQIYNSTSTCANVQRWTTPIAFNNKIVVGGNAHLCSWSLP